MAESGSPGGWEQIESKGDSRYGRQESREPHCKFLFTVETRVASEEEHEGNAGLFFSGWNKPKQFIGLRERSAHLRDA